LNLVSPASGARRLSNDNDETASADESRPKMHYEVEQKFVVTDLDVIARRLQELGAVPGEPVAQADRYYNHPLRDFGQTDEALRIRRVGDAVRVTYKGPKIDRQTKTRREIELPIGEHGEGPRAAEQFAELLELLGFRFVAEVQKARRTAELVRGQVAIEAALDDVRGVGLFVELEAAADDAGLALARQQIAALAAELGLVQNERRSYLELLLEKETPKRDGD
jgi:adenylate cyclase class 2